MKHMSSREFNHDIGKAKRAAEEGPLLITDRGKPAFVLLKHEEYQRLVGQEPSIVDLLRQDEPEADFDFEPPRLREIVRRETVFD
ncbi:prevent-host-death protein [Labrys okinawensis]|uniref:Antitoxin n=1 Tax=Labrys okinawensis TaxID=346911 RepID=A0A2S9QFY7_9HYPH|nr:type II toxin-antitoxin system Phd/YefM family antitoxin [Labrys okinawensis]PRH88210.1 prevent-host-death protein [Labrys okinawensis]